MRQVGREQKVASVSLDVAQELHDPWMQLFRILGQHFCILQQGWQFCNEPEQVLGSVVVALGRPWIRLPVSFTQV
jgi:hypothetical protein